MKLRMQVCGFVIQKIQSIFNQILQIEKMRKYELFLCVAAFLCALAGCDEAPTAIKLNTIYNISLNANSTVLYEINLPNIKAGQNLYISGYSAINDPDQEPMLKINSSTFTGTCEQQSSDLNEVCFVPNTNLKSGDKFTIQASCRIRCDARIIAYLSETVELDVGQQVQIQASDSPIEKMFKIFVPTELDYSEILLLFDVVNPNPTQGASMYIKTGKNVAYPTKNSHDNVRLLNWGLKTAAVLYKNVNIKAGDSIYVLLSIGEHSYVTFQSRKVSNQSSSIQLNQQFYDYLIPPTTYRVYTVDLSSINSTNLQYSLLIQFQQYSGSPTIEVSLNQQFSNEKLINPSPSLTKARFEITSSAMKSAEFSKKKVYVRVSTNWGSTFVIYAKLRVNEVYTLERGVAEYVEIKGQEKGVLIYRSLRTNRNATQFFKLKIINEGEVEAQLKVFACLQQNTYSCSIQKSADLSTLPATYKQLNSYEMDDLDRVQYTPTNDCVRESQQSEEYDCTFMVVLNPVDRTRVGKYAVSIEEPSLLIFLQQGQSYSAKVKPQEHIYFCFYLPEQTSIKGTTLLGLSFYVNILDGSVQLLSSSEVITPVLANLPNQKIKRGTTNITYGQFQIKPTLYYLTVYGIEYSDFTVTPVVRRYQANSTNYIRQNMEEIYKENIKITSVELVDSVAQSFILEKGNQGMQFRFRVPSYGNVTLVVTDLVGKVITYYTRESDHKRIYCAQNYCEFPAQPGDSFYIEVEGLISTLRQFTIAFKQLKQCYKYPLGSPIYVILQSKDTQCVEFTIRRQQAIEVSTSLTKLQLLNKDTQIAIQFQKTNYTFVLTSNSYQFSEQNLVKYCGQASQQFCKVKVKFISFNFPIQLEFVIQRVDGLLTLYDGVLQKIETKLSKTTGKYLRVPISIEEGVEIFVTSQTNTQYSIYAKLIGGLQTSNLSQYPTPSSKDVSWKVVTSLDSPTLTMLPIAKYKVKAEAAANNLTYGWLVISVFSSSEEPQEAVFDIEVTQNERILRVGQQHVGFLQANEIVMYEVYPSTISLLSIRQLGSFKCYKIMDESRKEITNDDIYIEQPRTVPLRYFIASQPAASCMYQISVQDYQNSILEITEGFPTRIVLQYRETTYLLYHHTQNKTFRIYEFVEAGSSAIYATPLRINDTQGIRDIVDDLSTSKYEYRGDQVNNLQVEAKENGTDYCYDCYYLIAVKGSPAVHEDLVVVRDPTPVTIRQHMIVDSYLDPPEKQTFIYYAGAYSSFNLSIDVVYGHVTVTVKSYADGPEGKIVKVQSVQNRMMVIPIKQQDPATIGLQESTDPLNQQRKYRIQVQAKSYSLYHLQVMKFSDTFRIVQGMVSKIQMPATGSLHLEFSTLIDQGQLELNIESKLTFNPIIPSVYFRAPGQSARNQKPANFSVRIAGKVLIVTFMATRGHYSIKLTTSERSSFEIDVLIPKSGLTELRPDTSVVATHETIFQIYIQEDSYAIIELFECSGNMKVRGSNELKNMQRSTASRSQLSLLHQNVGGHFVVTTPENVTGQYFIRVQSKEYTASISEEVSGLSYLIKYRLHKKSEKNPYEYLDIESLSIKVGAAEYLENVTIKIGKIKSIDQSIQIVELHYMLGIGTSPQDVRNYMVCSRKQDAQHLTFVFVKGGDDDELVELNISKLEIIKKVGEKQAYVGAYVLINIKHKNGTAYDNFVFMFEPAYLGKLKSTKVITATGLFEIMVIIVLIIGGAVIIYALAIYALRVYRGYSNTNELVEEDSESKIGNKAASSDYEIKAQTSQVKEVSQPSIA